MKVKDTKENREKCICKECPSYPTLCKGEVLYCSLGKSCCEIIPNNCLCNMCPVWAENKLNGIYFCDKTELNKTGQLVRKKRSDEDTEFYEKVMNIKKLASTGESIISSMGSLKKIPFSFDDLHFIPAQVSKIPLNSNEKVNTKIVIGPKSKKPLLVSSPILISGMSFGAVSKKVREVISRVSAKLGTGFNSGEGGILDDELKIASNYMIGQYATGRFGISDDKLKKVGAIEIRFGQGAYPGKGSFLPADKMTPEVAKVRGLKASEDAHSPAHHPDMRTFEEIKKKIDYLKKLTGVPVGAKIGCGNIEEDIKVLIDAEVDFIAIDGFCGGTGATEHYVKENVGIPLIAALPRAYKVLKDKGAKEKISLIAGGGLRTSADFAKCLAMGADAVYIGTAALIAINCEQYRICHTGNCPTGITTNNPVLMEQLNVDEGIRRLSNFVSVSTQEIANLTRIVGKDDIRKLDYSDLVSMKKDLSELTGIKWIN